MKGHKTSSYERGGSKLPSGQGGTSQGRGVYTVGERMEMRHVMAAFRGGVRVEGLRQPKRPCTFRSLGMEYASQCPGASTAPEPSAVPSRGSLLHPSQPGGKALSSAGRRVKAKGGSQALLQLFL